MNVFLGLKPQAESCSPFGTKISLSPVRKIEATPRVAGFEDEDNDEDENDLGASPSRLRKDRTRFSVTIWYEDPDLLRCHQAPIGAELPSGSEGS